MALLEADRAHAALVDVEDQLARGALTFDLCHGLEHSTGAVAVNVERALTMHVDLLGGDCVCGHYDPLSEIVLRAPPSLETIRGDCPPEGGRPSGAAPLGFGAPGGAPASNIALFAQAL